MTPLTPTINNDGASVPIPQSLVGASGAWGFLLRDTAGRLVEVIVMVMPRRDWERTWRRENPRFMTLPLGPLVLAVGVKS